MRILVLGDILGDFSQWNQLPELIQFHQIDALVFTGNLMDAHIRRQEWERAASEGGLPNPRAPAVEQARREAIQALSAFLRSLKTLGIPVYLVPGVNDAPERLFLQAAFNAEISGQVHPVHRSFFLHGSAYAISGFGGEITDGEREGRFFVKYPAWEAEYALEFLHQIRRPCILVFHSGSDEIMTHLIKSYAPHYAFCSGPRQTRVIATTHVISPGRWRDGEYAILDSRGQEVEFGTLRTAQAA